MELLQAKLIEFYECQLNRKDLTNSEKEGYKKFYNTLIKKTAVEKQSKKEKISN